MNRFVFQTCILSSMSRHVLVHAFLMTVLSAAPVWAQHEHHARGGFQWGAHAVGIVTHATPAILGQDLTEGYITQPSLMLAATGWQGRIAFTGVINLEGLTLERGELNHGVWGEGYIDRRHPHTYLHEAIFTLQDSVFGYAASLSAGKGFAPFGTDDPMVRPFVKYPSNHHLAQVLERLVVIGALRRGPVLLEAGTFNGDEPGRPEDIVNTDNFADSWSARMSLYPLNGLELQASYGAVESPEQPRGDGLDQRKRSASARFERAQSDGSMYVLAEYARTNDFDDGVQAFVFTSWLGEASLRRGGWTASARYENSTRPDEERTDNLFRSIRPAIDNSILGTVRWRMVSVAAEHDLRIGAIHARPFVEVTRAFVKSMDAFPVNDPRVFYGDDRIWNLSAGVKLGAGMQHKRMGRYGVAR